MSLDILTASGYFYFVLATFIIILLQKLLIRLIQRTVNKGKTPADVLNGIRVLIRFGATLLIIYAGVLLLNIGQTAAINLSIFLGSMLSFASMHAIQNFVAGMYLLFTRPFKVNDFVRIGNSEGVITEISLNYTTLLNFEGLIESIPNKQIINSTIINYDKKIRSTDQERLFWVDMPTLFDDGEVTHYTFVWGAPLIDLQVLKSKLNRVCQRFEPVFGYMPEYLPYTINHRFEFTFILRANDPVTILKNKPLFLNDIVAEFH